MEKSSLLIAMATILVALNFCFSGCNNAKNNAKLIEVVPKEYVVEAADEYIQNTDNSWIIGTWHPFEYSYDITFKTDGTFKVGGGICTGSGTYTIKGNKVSLKGKMQCDYDDDNVYEYIETFTIKNNQLDNCEKSSSNIDTQTQSATSDNSWLIGAWGPVQFSGEFGAIITYGIVIWENGTLAESSITTYPNGRKSSSEEYYTYTVNNSDNSITYTNGKPSGTMTIYFNRTQQTLNVGSAQNPMYMRKNSR